MQENNPTNPNQTENFRFLELAIKKDLGLKLAIHRKTEKGVENKGYLAKKYLREK